MDVARLSNFSVSEWKQEGERGRQSNDCRHTWLSQQFLVSESRENLESLLNPHLSPQPTSLRRDLPVPAMPGISTARSGKEAVGSRMRRGLMMLQSLALLAA